MISYNGLIKLGFTPDDFSLRDDSDGNGTYIKEWNSDQPQPSEADITTAHAEWEAEYDSQQYSRDRATDYPAIVDQLDDIFHNGIDGWKATIQLTKDKYPKGGN